MPLANRVLPGRAKFAAQCTGRGGRGSGEGASFGRFGREFASEAGTDASAAAPTDPARY